MNDIREIKSGGRPGFHLDRRNGKLMGVASAIADWTGLNTTLVRIAFVVGAFVSFGTAALIYLAIGLIAD
ncbi:PspC domain-containing protein [Porphyrobacter algicida]|uniref:PspC domain-containing protein n=1 Tax=Qipengyuania algicida TaxID=1836209 RepID=A0A845AIP6_9SPHN|nr:PspC domain-containing protein [Qipengyuania algicida]MXP28715.1 PspC domain-containing protein [Qipengyuania algicida]